MGCDHVKTVCLKMVVHVWEFSKIERKRPSETAYKFFCTFAYKLTNLSQF